MRRGRQPCRKKCRDDKPRLGFRSSSFNRTKTTEGRGNPLKRKLCILKSSHGLTTLFSGTSTMRSRQFFGNPFRQGYTTILLRDERHERMKVSAHPKRHIVRRLASPPTRFWPLLALFDTTWNLCQTWWYNFSPAI